MRLSALIAALLLAMAMTARAEMVLLMAEEPGCVWCARWNAEIAHIYPKTPEGRSAPLRRYDIRHGPPDGVTLDGVARFTPTFILLRDGVEVGRIEGYPGADFFWGLLGQLLERAQLDTGASG